MRIIKARVDGQMFILSPGTDVAALKSQVVAAARGGADFLDFGTVGHGVVSVLITSMIPVRFEVLDRSQEQVDEWEQHPPFIDGLVDADAYLARLEL